MTNYNESPDDKLTEILRELDRGEYLDKGGVPGAKQAILDWHNKQVKNAVVTAEDNLDQYWNKELDKQIAKATEAIKYMIAVWDEVQGNWRETPDHVQRKFLEAEAELKESSQR